MKKVNFVSLDLIKEIDNKKRYLEKEKLNFLVGESLINEANQHSSRIEYPLAVMYDDKKGPLEKSIAKMESEEAVENLKNAWVEGARIFKLPVTEKFIKKLTWYIDPGYFNDYSKDCIKEASYRRLTDSVRPSGASFTSTYPAKIPTEMSKFLREANLLCDKHPIDLSIFLHLHLTRIHPFPDCNGRASRLLQNLVLYNFGYAPAILYEGERRSYHQLLDDAIRGYKNRDGKIKGKIISKEEKRFYNFMAERININLDKTLDKKLEF
jgi:Fic family protein